MSPHHCARSCVCSPTWYGTRRGSGMKGVAVRPPAKYKHPNRPWRPKSQAKTTQRDLRAAANSRLSPATSSAKTQIGTGPRPIANPTLRAIEGEGTRNPRPGFSAIHSPTITQAPTPINAISLVVRDTANPLLCLESVVSPAAASGETQAVASDPPPPSCNHLQSRPIPATGRIGVASIYVMTGTTFLLHSLKRAELQTPPPRLHGPQGSRRLPPMPSPAREQPEEFPCETNSASRLFAVDYSLQCQKLTACVQ